MKYAKQNYNKIVIIKYIILKLLRNCVRCIIETILIKKKYILKTNPTISNVTNIVT